MNTAFTVAFAVVLFVLGSVIGSFINVIAYRVPIKESLVKGRSHCTSCGKQILNRDLIPIFSWFFLRGRCRFCKKRFSSRYMFVELLTAISYLGAFLVFGFSIKLAYAVVLFPVLMILSLWDLDRKEIPYTCSIIIALLGVASCFTADMPWYEHLIGCAVISVPFAVLCFLGAMGGGDVQLMAAAGLLLGWSIVPAAMIGIILGAIVGIVIKITTKLNLICFGPFLSVGIAAGFLWGQDMIIAYLALIR